MNTNSDGTAEVLDQAGSIEMVERDDRTPRHPLIIRVDSCLLVVAA